MRQVVLTNESVLIWILMSTACFTKYLVMSAKRTITQRGHWHLGNIQPQDSPEELRQNPNLDEMLYCLKWYILCSPRHFHPIISQLITGNQTNFLIICIGKYFAVLKWSESRIIQLFYRLSTQLHVNINNRRISSTCLLWKKLCHYTKFLYII